MNSTLLRAEKEIKPPPATEKRPRRMQSSALLPATLIVLAGLWPYDPTTFTQATARVDLSTLVRVTPSHLTVVYGDTV